MGPHLVPKRVYYAVFAALMVLTAVTVIVAFIDLGPFNNLIAMSIAVAKATLVVLYFMHVRYSSKLTWVFAGAGFIWLIILFVFMLNDYLTREAWSNLLTGQP
ncbi:MAG: cytochrome C oxidase subunit IV family protein [candidate division KSB1 bacterium]|nr:cytochrome C oxidase subunit IV family protein [candidate division KSB1 bacterium]MDZ7272903.1 cytochrome C oxidase subunit IV family protein [candidate division KSB1 bacterium]MDZ7284075.1 cytochrome C oxidase subunit IV family protein [candidate division KSB1 bacterium]MDZ7297528.1 cytochrome C oxidase subunit IV family protein [candidate division KSB1 bacterium]MDZ7309227.1 cytochrome C oxidase subunit IV family protein [candidate division KSB1 bacterium]